MKDNSLCIDTERLRLEPLTLADAIFVKTLFNDPDCLRFIGDKHIVDVASAERYLENGPIASYRVHGFGLFKVVMKSAKQVIGCCGLLKRDHLPNPDIGFAGLPTFRGQGYLYEASLAVLEHAKAGGVHRTIHALVDPDNIASIHLLKKLGMSYQRKLEPPVVERETNVYGLDFGDLTKDK